MNHHSRTARHVLGLFILTVFSLCIGFVLAAKQLKETPQEQVIWNSPTPFIGITHVQKGPDLGNALIRISDNVSQFFKDTKNISISKYGTNAAAFADQDLYAIVHGSKIIQANTQNKLGALYKVQFSPDGNFMALAIDEGDKEGYCIVELAVLEKGQVVCNNITVATDNPLSRWIPDDAHTFVSWNKPEEVSVWDGDAHFGYTLAKDENPTAFAYLMGYAHIEQNGDSLRCMAYYCIEKYEGGIQLTRSPFGSRWAKEIVNVSLHAYAALDKNDIVLINTASGSYKKIPLGQHDISLTNEAHLVVAPKYE